PTRPCCASYSHPPPIQGVDMNWLSRLYSPRIARANQLARRRWQPAFERLEDRLQPSASSSITANFNGTAIPAGDTLWFSGAFQASGLPKSAAATIHVDNGTINFTAAGTAYSVAVPKGVITLTPGATSATASFDPGDGDWDVNAP